MHSCRCSALEKNQADAFSGGENRKTDYDRWCCCQKYDNHTALGENPAQMLSDTLAEAVQDRRRKRRIKQKPLSRILHSQGLSIRDAFRHTTARPSLCTPYTTGLRESRLSYGWYQIIMKTLLQHRKRAYTLRGIRVICLIFNRQSLLNFIRKRTLSYGLSL